MVNLYFGPTSHTFINFVNDFRPALFARLNAEKRVYIFFLKTFTIRLPTITSRMPDFSKMLSITKASQDSTLSPSSRLFSFASVYINKLVQKHNKVVIEINPSKLLERLKTLICYMSDFFIRLFIS